MLWCTILRQNCVLGNVLLSKIIHQNLGFSPNGSTSTSSFSGHTIVARKKLEFPTFPQSQYKKIMQIYKEHTNNYTPELYGFCLTKQVENIMFVWIGVKFFDPLIKKKMKYGSCLQ